MMNGEKLTLIWSLGALLTLGCLSSCETSWEEKLTNTQWQIVSMQSDTHFDFNFDGIANTDVFNENIPCKLDDIFILKPAGILILDENEDACYYPQQRKGQWSVKERTLMLHPNGTPTTWFDIQSLDKDEMRTIYYHYDGGEYKVSVVFKAIPDAYLLNKSE